MASIGASDGVSAAEWSVAQEAIASVVRQLEAAGEIKLADN